jgi:hypothetical protein
MPVSLFNLFLWFNWILNLLLLYVPNHATGVIENAKAELREYKVKEGLAHKTFEVLSN